MFHANNRIILLFSGLLLLGGIFFYQKIPMDESIDGALAPIPSQHAPTTTSATSTPSTPSEIPPPGIPAPSSQILPYGKTTLHLGETARFNNLSFELVRVFDDSRCPKGVTCIWAGTLKTEIRILSGMGESIETVELGKSIATEAETITFLSATPYSEEGKAITTVDYALTFSVTQRGVQIPPKQTPPLMRTTCYVGGCSGEVCSNTPDVASACIYREEFACYKKTTCERQSTGQCGWTETAELRACLDTSGSI